MKRIILVIVTAVALTACGTTRTVTAPARTTTTTTTASSSGPLFAECGTANSQWQIVIDDLASPSTLVGTFVNDAGVLAQDLSALAAQAQSQAPTDSVTFQSAAILFEQYAQAEANGLTPPSSTPTVPNARQALETDCGLVPSTPGATT